MRILLFGGWGQLGSDLALEATGRHDLIRPPHSEVDVSNPESVENLVGSVAPDAVLNAAAFHKVEICEQDPITTFAVNAIGALNVARAARGAGAVCGFVSTDYVFDGEKPDGYAEDSPVSPLSVYGVSKAAGERNVLNTCPNGLVLRGSALFGHAGSSGKGGNFIETMLSKAESGQAISVVDDQFFAPSATRDMAARILLLLERRVPPGIYHVANAGSCSWYEFAVEAFRLAGLSPDLTPRPAGEQAVRRPRSSILLDTKSNALGLPPARPWQEALAWYLDNRPGRDQAAVPAGRAEP